MRDQLVILLHNVEELRVVGFELIDPRAFLNAHAREAQFRFLEFIAFLCPYFETPKKFVFEKIQPNGFLIIICFLGKAVPCEYFLRKIQFIYLQCQRR